MTFCTADFGKIRGIAKGARRSRKRFANALEPFCLLPDPLFPEKSGQPGPDRRVRCPLPFPGIRSDLEKTLAASYLIDLTDQFTPEDKKSEASFRLLLDFLRLLEEGPA